MGFCHIFRARAFIRLQHFTYCWVQHKNYIPQDGKVQKLKRSCTKKNIHERLNSNWSMVMLFFFHFTRSNQILILLLSPEHLLGFLVKMAKFTKCIGTGLIYLPPPHKYISIRLYTYICCPPRPSAKFENTNKTPNRKTALLH